MNNVLEDKIRRELYQAGYELDTHKIKIYPMIDDHHVLFSLIPNLEYLFELRLEFYEESPEYIYFSKEQYGLYDKEKRRVAVLPVFDEIGTESNYIYTVLTVGTSDDNYQTKEYYTPTISCDNPIIVDVDRFPNNEYESYIIRRGAFTGWSIGAMASEHHRYLAKMIKDKELHVQYHLVDEDEEIDELLERLCTYSDCHHNYFPINKEDDSLKSYRSYYYPYGYALYEGWSFIKILRRNYKYLALLVENGCLDVDLSLRERLKEKYPQGTHMRSRIDCLEKAAWEYELNKPSEPYAYDVLDDSFLENAYRGAFEGDPEAEWNID